jgi:hypothetical protein
MTSSITVVVTEYGQALELAFTNGHATLGAYLTTPTGAAGDESLAGKTALIYGRVYSNDKFTVRESDSTSITANGKRTKELDLIFKSNPYALTNQAQWMRDRYKTAIPQPTMKLNHRQGWPTDTIKILCLSLKLSDRITCKVTRLGTDKDYFINKIIQDYKVLEGGKMKETTYVLQEADTVTYWLLGTVDRGELGTNTILGF